MLKSLIEIKYLYEFVAIDLLQYWQISMSLASQFINFPQFKHLLI
jgi:hypothetical protein